MPASLKRYWLTGAGAAKIRWGEGGDFMRCVTAINAEITKHGRKPLPDHEIKGLCANLHREATGATPGNAPGERHLARRVKLADIADNSDPVRLAGLDSATRERLQRKYRHALEAVSA